MGQSFDDQLDALLMNAEYEAVIKKVNEQSNPSALSRTRQCEALIMTGKINEAMALLNTLQALSSSHPALPGILETEQGLIDINQGKFNDAAQHLQQALTHFENAGLSATLDAARTMATLGFALKSTGKTTQAEQQLIMALEIRKKLLPAEHELLAATYNDLGFVYSKSDNDKALEYYDQATALYEKIHGKEHPKIAIALINTGIVYRDLEFYGDAVNNFESALSIWDKIYAQPHPQKAFTLLNLGETYMKMKDLKAALGYYERALAMYEKTYGTKHPDLAYVHNVIGNVKASQDLHEEALQHYQQAIIANVRSFDVQDPQTNPSTREFYNGNVLLYSLMYKAQVLEQRYFGKTLRPSDLTLALNTLFVCDSLIDRLRQQISHENDKLTLGAISNEVYADGVRMAFTLGDVSLHKQIFREQSFYFAEKSKSAVLLEAISDANAKSFANIPAALLEEEAGYKEALALLTQKLAQKPSVEEERYLREAAFKLDRDYRQFIQQLEARYPEYFNLKYNVASPSVAQLQQLLPEATALLSYFIDEKNSRLYTYTISKKKFRIESQSLPANYDKLITGLRNSVMFLNTETYIRIAQQLHKTFIPSLPSSINDLVILPAGRMSVIPFEALLEPRKIKSTEFNALPYLMRRYSVRYDFSAALVLQKKNTARAAGASVLLCAPVTFPVRENLPELPGTEKEVNTLSQMFSGKQITCSTLLAKEANETKFKSINLLDYSVIHLATHGIVDEEHPELSRIFLQTQGDSEDGNLFTGEIYNLQLNADLVTLSACQTGLGKISKGEGVIGLSRALVYAGARNMMVSFWSVADESTAQLMTDFYQKSLEQRSQSYSQVLRQSKLALLTGDFAAPYYWAPFILIGF
jgi:CHAT domain-containing protein